MRSGYRIFDSHTHIGVARHSGRVYTAEQMLRAMDAYGVDRSMLIPFPVVDDYRAAHDEIGLAVRAWPDRFAGAASLCPYVPEREYRDEVRRCGERYGFQAVKLQPQYQAVNPISARTRFIYEAAAENGMALICHTGTGVPFALPSLFMLPAREFPEVPFVLAHAGGGGVFASEAIVAASFCPNVFLELSTLMPNHIAEVLARVPADRLMISSDVPENLETELGKIFSMQITEEDRRAILAGTADAVFRTQ